MSANSKPSKARDDGERRNDKAAMLCEGFDALRNNCGGTIPTFPNTVRPCCFRLGNEDKLASNLYTGLALGGKCLTAIRLAARRPGLSRASGGAAVSYASEGRHRTQGIGIFVIGPGEILSSNTTGWDTM